MFKAKSDERPVAPLPPPPLHHPLSAGPTRTSSEADWAWEYWDQCSSTMDQVRGALERHKDKHYVVVSCGQQINGRGTSERQWLSPIGNVYMTMAVHKSKFVRDREFLLPLETALVTAQSIEKVGGLQCKVQLKWPNDVVIDGKKVSGCLIEDVGEYRLIGIGINVEVAPEV